MTVEPVAGDFVQRVADHADVLRLLRLSPVEVGARRELERQRLRLERGRPGLAEQRRDGDRARLNGGEDGPLPCVLELLERERRRLGGGAAASVGCAATGVGGSGFVAEAAAGTAAAAAGAPAGALLELLDPEGE